MWPENQFQAIFNFQRILCKKKSEQVCMMIYIITYLSSLLQKCHLLIQLVLNSLQTQKDLELVFRLQFFQNFLVIFFFCNMTQTGQISSTDCVYFPSHSVEYFSCFMLRPLMMSQNLNISKNLKFNFLENKKSF